MTYSVCVALLGLFVTAEPFNAEERPGILLQGAISIAGGILVGLIQSRPQPRGPAITLLGVVICLGVYGAASFLSMNVLYVPFPVAAMILLYQFARPRTPL